jgi:catechol 2,3-dioxygenase-like lactoylglutathione lyase family enzyme
VDDIHAAHAELSGRGVQVTDVTTGPGGAFVYFADPDGNTWTVQDPRA